MTTLLALETNGALIATDQAGSVAVTQSGPVRFSPGKNARVNYHPNPRAQTNTAQAIAVGAATVTRLTTDGARPEAQTCFNVVTTATAAGEGLFLYAIQNQQILVTGKPVRFAFSIKRLVGPALITAIMQIRSAANAAVETSPVVNINTTGDWSRVVVEFTPTSPLACFPVLYLYTYNRTEAVTFRVTDVVITVDDANTSPLDLAMPGTNPWNPLTGYLASAGAGPIASMLAARVEPAKTNYLINPSAENASIATGIAAVASATVTKSTEAARNGGNSAKVVTPGSVLNEGVFFGSTGALGLTGSALPFVGSVWVRGAAGQNLQAQLRGIYSDATQQVGTAVNFVTTGNWQRIVLPGITTNAAKTLNNLIVYVWTQAASIVTFYADEAQVEDGTAVTGYLDGSLGTGHAWTSTAHGSTSTRTASSVTVPVAGRVNPSAGALLVRFCRLHDMGAVEGLLDVGASSGGYDRLGLRINASDKLELSWQSDAKTQYLLATTESVPLDTQCEAYAEWTGTAVRLSLNGGTLYTAQRDVPQNNIYTNPITLGTFIGGSLPFSGAIGGILVTDTPLPDTTILPVLATVPWTLASLDVPVYYPIESTDGRLVHQTKFGSVNFGIYWGPDPEGMPDWAAPFLTVARHVPGSSITKVQTLGKGALTVTYRVQLDTIEDFLALQDLQGSTATLRVVGDTVTVPGTAMRIVDETFVDISEVTLVSLTNVLVIPETREVDCDAIFLRQAS